MTATDSQVAMWRGAIALAYADNQLSDSEKAKLQDYFTNNVFLSPEQRTLLLQDVEKGVQLKDVWDGITDKMDRAHLIDLAPAIFSADGTYSPTEHEVYDRMFSQQMSALDVEKLKGEMQATSVKIVAERAVDEQETLRNLTPVGRMLYRLGNFFGA